MNSAGSVHPRARGEHLTIVALGVEPAGSSPRSRGTRHASANNCDVCRFIPALAGNTPPRRPGGGCAPVHPRARGEHHGPDHMTRGMHGSSPRSRGTRVGEFDAAGHVRFIPALAGNTPSWPRRAGAGPVHPRARGEHDGFLPGKWEVSGSSPRSRGTLVGGQQVGRHGRFIPALAGNTLWRAGWHRAWPVHPRARGEHVMVARRRSAVSGSSPRSRGTPAIKNKASVLDRFIPALAGNTAGRFHRPESGPVHPRARGEHRISGDPRIAVDGSSPRSRGTRSIGLFRPPRRRFIPALAGNTLAKTNGNGAGGGSSPRSRGTPVSMFDLDQATRFIPALAGNTCSACPPATWCPVHPRARGEHSRKSGKSHQDRGSSPRSRGTQPARRSAAHVVRFIPALAGNTTENPNGKA